MTSDEDLKTLTEFVGALWGGRPTRPSARRHRPAQRLDSESAKGLNEFLTALLSDDEEKRSRAVDIFNMQMHTLVRDLVLDRLFRRASSPREDVQQGALRTLRSLGAPAVLRVLLRLARARRTEGRVRLVRLLADVANPHDPMATAGLLCILVNVREKQEVLVAAREALGRLRPGHDAVHA